MKTRIAVTAVAMGVLLISSAGAKIVTQTVEYKQGETVCEGYLAYDDAVTGKRPGVAVVHNWMGVNEGNNLRARELAEMGYVALSVDIYGKGVRASNGEEAGKLASIYRGDRALMRARVEAGIDFLRRHELVEPTKLAAIGFCFGGGCVLELARGGADVKGVVSFHGNLDTPNPEDARNIKCKVLVCHGADDPYVTWDAVAAFKSEMQNANVNWQLNAYGGAVHSFTEVGADSDGARYHEQSAKRAWQDMQDFFREIFE